MEDNTHSSEIALTSVANSSGDEDKYGSIPEEVIKDQFAGEPDAFETFLETSIDDIEQLEAQGIFLSKSDLDAMVLAESFSSYMPRQIQVQSAWECAGQLFQKYKQSGDIGDLNMAIFWDRKSASLASDQDPNKIQYLLNWAISLIRRFKHSREQANLDAAITLQQQAIELMSEDEHIPPSLFDALVESLLMRYEKSGDVTDMDIAISFLQQAITLTADENASKPGRMRNLAIIFFKRFLRFGEVEDIDEAIKAQQQAAHLASDTSKPRHIDGLGALYSQKFERFGELEDADKAILAQQQAINLTPDGHPDKPGYLHNLGISLSQRFERFGVATDIDKAISVQQQAVSFSSDGHLDKPARLHNLGNMFRNRFRGSGEVADIDKAISLQQQAINLTTDGHPDTPDRLNNLGTSFQDRFRRFGEIADIDKAISVQHQAISLTPENHPSKPRCISGLGFAFSLKFERFGEVTDIDKAILAQEHAVNLTPDGHPDKLGHINNLGISFSRRFDMLGEVVDIEKAILIQQQAVDLTPDRHADKASRLNNLGSFFQARFRKFKEAADIEKAILVQRQAIDIIPDSHAEKHGCLNNLGISFQRQFDMFGRMEDIDQAILVLQQAVDLAPDGDNYKPGYMRNLGDSFEKRFLRTSNENDLRDSLASFSNAATSLSGSPRHRLSAARSWALLASNHLPPDGRLSALEACHILLDLVPRVIWLGNSVSLRYQDISEIGSAITMAVSIACKFDRPDYALEWLEQGRSIIWGQVLHLRTPMDDLRRTHPDIVTSMENISRQLEVLTASPNAFSITPSTLVNESELGAQKHRRLAEEWEGFLATVCQYPGYEDFLRPKKLAALAPAAILGPMIYINVEKARCDAIIIRNTDGDSKLDHVHLSLASLDKINKAYSIFNEVLMGRSARWSLDSPYPSTEKVLEDDPSLSKHIGASQTPEDSTLVASNEPSHFRATQPTFHLRKMERVLQMLWKDIVEPVFRVLGYMDTTPSKQYTLPRVTWCTTGPLSFLPLHAAGQYSQDGSVLAERTYKYAVSSYTPSSTMLLGREQDTSADEFRGLAAISQPSTAGQNPLPGTVAEVKAVRDQFDEGDFTWLNDSGATQDVVLQQMRERSWIHLACHGVQHNEDPMESAFMLHDRPLDLRTISRQALPHARLAYLSACQTAKGDERLPQESAHLAAGMLMIGYRTVIGTMWSIGDRDAPVIAEKFYRYLKAHGMKTNDGQAAYALHEAVAYLRERVGEENFLSWVPFIHLGI